MKHAKWIVAVLFLLPISVFAFYKPIRVLIPEAFGLTCREDNVCIDDVAQLDAAVSLLMASRHDLESRWGLVVGQPRMVFCSTDPCRQTFGLSQKAGMTLGMLGILIAPRGWQRHYVTHELIHRWQAENFGPLVGWLGEPWMVEGMAYALSNDPRDRLNEPFESYRQQFNEWHRLHAGVPLKQSVGEVL